MRRRGVPLAALVGACVVFVAAQDKPAKEPRLQAGDKPAGVLDFVVENIDGQRVELSRHRGKVLLIVNVASECGLTRQYEQLQELHQKYHERGLAILAFPSNDFGQQEPGTHEQIKEFCKSRYGVTFDLFAKVPVVGENATELYKFLTSPETNGELAGPIRWNFTKFLVDREGKVVSRFEPRVRPDDEQVIQAIEKALGKPE